MHAQCVEIRRTEFHYAETIIGWEQMVFGCILSQAIFVSFVRSKRTQDLLHIRAGRLRDVMQGGRYEHI